MSCVFVVEGDALLRQVAADILVEEGYPVSEVANGSDALRTLEHHQPAPVLLDLVLPVVDGQAFLEPYRSKIGDQPLPLVVMSSVAIDESRTTRALEMGAVTILQLPFGLEELVSVVRSTIGPPPAST